MFSFNLKETGVDIERTRPQPGAQPPFVSSPWVARTQVPELHLLTTPIPESLISRRLRGQWSSWDSSQTRDARSPVVTTVPPWPVCGGGSCVSLGRAPSLLHTQATCRPGQARACVSAGSWAPWPRFAVLCNGWMPLCMLLLTSSKPRCSACGAPVPAGPAGIPRGRGLGAAPALPYPPLSIPWLPWVWGLSPGGDSRGTGARPSAFLGACPELGPRAAGEGVEEAACG